MESEINDILAKVKQFKISALAENKNLFTDAIVDCVNALIIDQQGVILFSTSQVNELFGYIEGELDGMNLHQLMPERFRGNHQKHIQYFFAQREKRIMGQQKTELIGLTRTGQEFNVQIELHQKMMGGERVAIAIILKMNIQGK